MFHSPIVKEQPLIQSNLLLPIIGQMFRQSLESQARRRVSWEDKHHNHCYPPLLLPSLSFCC